MANRVYNLWHQRCARPCFVARVARQIVVRSVMMDDTHPNADKLLKLGEIAPDFTLVNGDGQRLQLAAALAQGVVLLVFYRGDW